MSATTVVLSPHFDDAVLSCWHLLHSDADVRVVNVFTGVPMNGQPTGWWDVLTGAADSAGRMRERAVEDKTALAVAGREAVGLGLLDEQYRAGQQPLEAVLDRLRSTLPPHCTLAAPAGLGGHTDHALVRDACRRLGDEGYDVLLYADLPGAVRFGWPSWVSGEDTDPHIDVDAHWRWRFTEAGLDPGALRPSVHELRGSQHVLKREAVRHYSSQVPALNGYARLNDPATLAYEVTWTTA